MLKRFVRRLVVDQLQRQESLRTRLHRLLNDAENGTSGMAETESVPIVEAPPAEPVEPPLPEGVVQSIHLEYPVRPRCRFPESQSYPEVYRILNAGRERYRQWLASFNQFQQFFLTIPKNPDPEQPSEPYWLNGFMENLDPIALYSLVALHKPKRYVEIGSGNSTKFVRRAIRDHDLKTTITSLDPNPRAEIDSICDRCLRISLEDSDLTLFQELEEGDIVFMDGSHRVFPNSDATVFFLEVLPALQPGVLVQIHDIKLPYDYPEEWSLRFYSEQYLLAGFLLGGTEQFEVLLPHALVTYDDDLKSVLQPIFADPYMAELRISGASFWVRKR